MMLGRFATTLSVMLPGSLGGITRFTATFCVKQNDRDKHDKVQHDSIN